MRKNKVNDVFKVSVASILSIGIFSAGFLGVNNIAFASAINKTESIATAVAAVNIRPTDNELPEGYPKHTLTVYEAPDSNKKSANAISMEEAAEIGAQYIMEIFGESIDGKTVEMFYMSYPYNTRAYWDCSVADSKSELENNEYTFQFTLDAVSGERIGISSFWDWKSDGKLYTQEEREGLTEKYYSQSGIYLPIAQEYAKKHFNHSAVTSVVYNNTSGRMTGKETITFTATDDTEREAYITIDVQTKQLLNIDTTFNDIIPGFNADVPGSVG